MTQNMFQEGLYQVFFKSSPPAPHSLSQVTSPGELVNVRIHRWFGTVVSARLLVAGVVQILGAAACLLATISHACVSYGCALVMFTPVWSSLSYFATGGFAIEVQRKANKIKIIILIGLNIFSLLFGFSALLANSLTATKATTFKANQQRIGSYVAKGSSITFSTLCFLASVYILFLSWKGLRRYSSPKTYSRLSEEHDDNTLFDQTEYDL